MTTNLEILCEHLGVSRKTMSEVETPVMSLLVSDCFGQPWHGKGHWTNAAVDRAIKSGCSFASEHNTVTTMASRFIEVKCPHCGGKTDVHGSSGNNAEMTIGYVCRGCGTTTSLTLPTIAGISVRPKDNKLDKLYGKG